MDVPVHCWRCESAGRVKAAKLAWREVAETQTKYGAKAINDD
jgi:hypothetical protein